LVDAEARRKFLAAIGDQPRLEQLRLERWEIDGQELALLRGLGNLKSLALHEMLPPPGRSERDPPLLTHLPPLPRLEALDLAGSAVGDRDLHFVASLSRLRSLSLLDTDVTCDGLADLAPLESLDELAMDNDAGQWGGFEALLALKRLKKLHIMYFDEDWLKPSGAQRDEASRGSEAFSEWLQALAALRKAKPGLAIDEHVEERDWSEQAMGPADPETSVGAWAREAVQAWKEKQAGK
jgi:hypothetical protein